MNPHDIPAELKAMLDEDAGKVHSASGAVMASLARILTAHREMMFEEVNDAFSIMRSRHAAEQEIHEATAELMVAYRRLFDEQGFRGWLADHDGGDALAEIDRLEHQLDKLTCQCCVFGNHSLPCTCDGEECCHPEQYEAYLPERKHGEGWSAS